MKAHTLLQIMKAHTLLQISLVFKVWQCSCDFLLLQKDRQTWLPILHSCDFDQKSV